MNFKIQRNNTYNIIQELFIMQVQKLNRYYTLRQNNKIVDIKLTLSELFLKLSKKLEENIY